MPLYHLAPITLAPGSEIQPGNFGRMIKRYRTDTGSNAWLLSRELIFESVREQIAPNAPSRLSACFAIDDLGAAQRYQAHNDGNFLMVMHEVELVDAAAPQHSGSLPLIDFPQPGHPFLDTVRAMANAYWSGGGSGDREIVTASALRVVQVI